MSNLDNCNEGKNFVEFRRKVQASEVLSAAIEGKEKRNTHEGALKSEPFVIWIERGCFSHGDFRLGSPILGVKAPPMVRPKRLERKSGSRLFLERAERGYEESKGKS
jgi:hypothetical protein